MNTVYGDIPDRSIKAYLKALINKTYKILPMKEENSSTLKLYIEGFVRELTGFMNLFDFLIEDQQFMTLITTLVYLASEDYDNLICKKEVFKCIHIVEHIEKSYFGEA